MAAERAGIESLPNEDHKLILECFHPSAKLTTPGLICDYISTDGLGNGIENETSLYEDIDTAGRLGKLASLYSHFRPLGPHEVAPRRGGYLVREAFSNTETEIPSQIVSLESHELFSQLCTIVNLMKVIPDVEFLLSCITIGEGVIRIWRDWLAERAMVPRSRRTSPLRKHPKSASEATDLDNTDRMLWLDNARNVGIRLHVIEREDLGTPILISLDEDAYVTYSIEYEEVVIRATQLLMKVEKSLLQETNETSKAIIIGPYQHGN